jgi:hypothetical protein
MPEETGDQRGLRPSGPFPSDDMVDARHDAHESGINPPREFPFAAGVQPEWVERQYGREVGEDVMKKAVWLAGTMLLGVTVLCVTVLGTAASAEVSN